MNAKTNTAAATDDTVIDAELDALLTDATATETTVVAAAANEPTAEIDLEEIEAAAIAEQTRAEAYAEQPAEEPAPVTSIATAAAKKAARAPRRVSIASMPDEDLRKVACLLTTDDPATVDADGLKETVSKLAKKVTDKAENLLQFRETGDKSKLQVFTRLGMEFLKDKGIMTSKDLADHFQAIKYSPGTARSQANQLMTLLPALKVADRSGKSISMRADSAIAALL